MDGTQPVYVARIVEAQGARLVMQGARGERVSLTQLEPEVVRVQVLPEGRPRLGRTWAVVGPDGDVPFEGRDREDVSRFSLPPLKLDPPWRPTAEAARNEPAPGTAEGPGQAAAANSEVGPAVLVATGPVLRLRVQLRPFAVFWYGPQGYLAGDHPELGYQWASSGRVTHYVSRDVRESYFGLGEVAGPLDHHGRRFRLEPTDAFGYDAELSDPLYKHFPFVLTVRPDGTAYGVLYDNPSAAVFDFGRELSGYHGPYRYAAFGWGDLDFYFLYGPSVEAVVERLTWLTGRTSLPPRWSLGYLASSMHYTEAAEPAAELERFAERARVERVPCDLIHLSSGYTLSDTGQRHVFEWNRRRVPDPAGLVARLRKRGLRVAANVKPVLLPAHPRFDELARKGCFVRGAGGEPVHLQKFWGGAGAHLDFTVPETRAWWMEQVRRQLLDVGVEATWNDNNEYPLWTSGARCTLPGTPGQAAAPGCELSAPGAPAQSEAPGSEGPAAAINPVQTLLMVKASRQAQQEHGPDRRPFVITRSASVGMQRYAQTWSGDNTTSWKTLRFNVPMGLNLALSGMANGGHDVGGFAGDVPEPELLVRWVQNGIFHPRFCIHSWKPGGPPTEPWMYPEVAGAIREAIELRYRLMPYLYTLFWEASQQGHPVHRPLAYHYPEDPRARVESFDFMVGPFLLVPLVAEKGMRRRRVYFPGREAWFDFHGGYPVAEDRGVGQEAGGREGGGREAEVETPLERPAVLAREGALIPMGKVMPYVGAEPDDLRLVRTFPGRTAGESRWALYEDDGESLDYQAGAFTLLHLYLRWDPRAVRLEVDASPVGWRLPYRHLLWLLPPGESRPAEANLPTRREGVDPSGWRFVEVALPPEWVR